MITEKKQIANIFNHFFCNIPKQIEKGIIPTQKTFDDFLTNPIEQSFKFDLNHLNLSKKLLHTSKHLKTIKVMDLSIFQINFLKDSRNPSVHLSPF